MPCGVAPGERDDSGWFAGITRLPARHTPESGGVSTTTGANHMTHPLKPCHYDVGCANGTGNAAGLRQDTTTTAHRPTHGATSCHGMQQRGMPGLVPAGHHSPGNYSLKDLRTPQSKLSLAELATNLLDGRSLWKSRFAKNTTLTQLANLRLGGPSATPAGNVRRR